MTVALIVAAAENDAIGYRGSVPWEVREDLARFRQLTMGHAVIVGAATQRSIVERLGHSLRRRHTVVVSRQLPPSEEPGVTVARTTEEALAEATAYAQQHDDRTVFVAGGASIYEQFIQVTELVYLTRLHMTVTADRFMPSNWLAGFGLVAEHHRQGSGGAEFSFLDYERAS